MHWALDNYPTTRMNTMGRSSLRRERLTSLLTNGAVSELAHLALTILLATSKTSMSPTYVEQVHRLNLSLRLLSRSRRVLRLLRHTAAEQLSSLASNSGRRSLGDATFLPLPDGSGLGEGGSFSSLSSVRPTLASSCWQWMCVRIGERLKPFNAGVC